MKELEAVRRGLVPTAVYTLLRTHAEDPQATAAQKQWTAINKTAEQLTYSTHRYLQHAATPPQTDQAHLLKLLHTIQRAQHWHGTQRHYRIDTYAQQHARAASPHPPTPPSLHRYHQRPATACPLCVRQRLPQTALPCNPDHWVCLGAAHCLTRCPHCGDLNPHHRERPAAPAASPPASHPSSFGPVTDTLRDHLGGYYVADAADRAWTMAVATGSAPLPPHSPPLRHSGGGLNVAACHVLLALYLHHRDLHLPDPQLPAPQAAALTPEAWADTAPEEIAASELLAAGSTPPSADGKEHPTHSAHSSTRHTTPTPRS